MEVALAQLKIQLRSCATRLQHAQSKFESSAQVTKRDISTLLRQETQQRAQASFHRSVDSALDAQTKTDEADRTLEIARQKAEKIMSDDRKGQIMDVLERSCDILAEARMLPKKYQNLDRDSLRSVCDIIEGAPRVDAKELHTLRDLLSDIYDPLTSAVRRQPHVHPMVVQPLTRPPQHEVDAFLISIAQAYEVEWQPPYPLPEQRLRSIAEILDPNSSPSVDLTQLKSLCVMGIPEQPPWVRPRTWRLLFGLVPPDKEKWSTARQRSRADYIALAGPILTSVRNLPEPSSTTKPEQMDKYLVQFSQDIDSLPPNIRQGLDEIDFPEPPPQTETEITPPPLQYADAVSARLDAIRARPGPGTAKPSASVPSITLERDPMSPTADLQDAHPPTTLLASDGKPKSSVWEGILLRLLHIHCVLHASYGLPEGPSTALVAILGVLLCVFSSDTDGDTSPHPDTEHPPTDLTNGLDAESSAFWAMESLISGLREALEEETESTSVEGWNQRFSRMLHTIDAPLWEDLRRKSLDPALPYYSHRWIPTLFTHTLHINEVLPIWDAVFTLPAFAQDAEATCPPQVEFLLNVGVTMLTRARVSLFRLGKGASPGSGPRSLWAEEQFALPLSVVHTPGAYSPVGSPWPLLSPASTAWGFLGGRAEGGEAGEVFLKGVKILQSYDVEEFGGIERLLQGAWGSYSKGTGRGAVETPAVHINRERETQANGKSKQGQQQPQMSRFDRLAEAVWRGITNEADGSNSSSPSPSPSVPPSPGVVVPKFMITAPPSNKPAGLGFGAMIRDTVWKGVTNQVDLDVPSPDPSPEPSPVATRSPSPLLVAEDEAPNVEQDQKQGNGGGSGSGGGGGSWFGGIRDSDAAAALAKTSTNLRVRAMDVLGRTSPKPEPKPWPESVIEAPTFPVSSSGSWVASLAALPSRVSLALGTVPEGHPAGFNAGFDAGFDAGSRHGSLSIQPPEREVFASRNKHDSYSPPQRPSVFRPARDSILPTVSPYFSPTSSTSETPTSKGSAIQSALAALTGPSTTPVKKSGPKPLLLNSKSLITASGSHSRTPSRTASPLPPNSANRHSRTSTVSSSSRNNSVDQLILVPPGVVSLRRGPVTSPRMVGGPNAGRAAFNSRDSISSAGSTRHSEHRFSYEESSVGDRDSKHYSFGRIKNPGFIMDQGSDSPVTVGNRDSTSTGTSGARTSPPQSLHIEAGMHEQTVPLNDSNGIGAVGRESGDDAKIPADALLRVASDDSPSDAERSASPQARLRSKRHRDASALDLNSEARRNLGDDTLASPPSAGFSSSLEPGIAYDELDATPLATPATPDSTVTVERKRATLSRSKTPRAVRRPHKGTGEESVSSPTPRMSRRNGNGNGAPSRDSTALVSGSEEEGTKADVEDEDELYTDLIDAY